MPVRGMEMGERPADSGECQSSRDFWILVNVVVIVVIEKARAECWPEDEQNDSSQKDADRSYGLAIVSRSLSSLVSGAHLEVV